jgi:hypothetical protein
MSSPSSPEEVAFAAAGAFGFLRMDAASTGCGGGGRNGQQEAVGKEERERERPTEQTKSDVAGKQQKPTQGRAGLLTT